MSRDDKNERYLAWSADGVERPDSYIKFYEPGSIGDLRFRFMRRLVVSARRWRARVDQRMRRVSQTQARWEALVSLSAHSPGLTQRELARLNSVEDPTVARLLTGLERDGAVRRSEGTRDRRQKIVSLTDDGAKALAAMQLVTDLLRDAVLQDLEPEELKQGLAILDKILARLETL
ncbi:MAG TPA: MarR family transcriptional regulator [Sphingomonadaceae bacterium]|nr:MarR family transcriptional regulator [Sphingomonadaceae bacterium]